MRAHRAHRELSLQADWLKAVKTHHPENERIKRDYLLWLGDAEDQAEATLGSVAAAIQRFETYTGFKSFKTFRPEHAVAFKRRLVEERNAGPAHR